MILYSEMSFTFFHLDDWFYSFVMFIPNFWFENEKFSNTKAFSDYEIFSNLTDQDL